MDWKHCGTASLYCNSHMLWTLSSCETEYDDVLPLVLLLYVVIFRLKWSRVVKAVGSSKNRVGQRGYNLRLPQLWTGDKWLS